jgi:spermidine synthase
MPDGAEIALYERRGAYEIRVDGIELMSSRARSSEEWLGALAARGVKHVPEPSILVAGLGLGYTLRAVLDSVGREARVTVVEVVPAVVEWNRGAVGHLAGHPTDDERVDVVTEDAYDVLSRSYSRWDAVVMDIDNGPSRLSMPSNERLYTDRGLQRIHKALRADGVAAIWSPEPQPELAESLEKRGFTVALEELPARTAADGVTHALYLAHKV